MTLTAGRLNGRLPPAGSQDELNRLGFSTAPPRGIIHIPPRGLPLISLGELRQRLADKPDVDWLVRGLLPNGGTSLLVADPKAGKSTLARCLAHSVVTGQGEWLGRDVVEGGAVVLIALEERLESIARHFNMLGTPDDGLHLLAEPAPSVDRLVRLTESAADLDPSLIVIDTAIRWIGSEDGNDYAAMTRELTPIIDLARTSGAHVMLVHHSRKSGGQHGHESLGSQAILGAVDVYVSIRRDPRSDVRSCYAEGRDDVRLREVVLELDEDSGQINVAGDLKQARIQDKGREILDYLQGCEGEVTQTAIFDAVPGSRTVLSSALRRVVDADQVERGGDGKPGAPYRYICTVPLKGEIQNTGPIGTGDPYAGLKGPLVRTPQRSHPGEETQ